MTVSLENANEVALDAIAFLLADEDRLLQFLSFTGADPGQLRERLNDKEFHASILDYLLQNELLLISFASEIQVTPETISRARIAIAGAPDFEI